MLPILSSPTDTSYLPYNNTQPGLPHPFVSDMMRVLQSSVEKEFQKVSSKLDNVIERIDALEKSHTSLETKVQMGSCVPSESSTPTSSGTGKRKRQTPVALQVNSSPSCDNNLP